MRGVALLALAAVASSCAGIGSGSFSGKPADVYAIIPDQAGVRSLMGDNDWWEGAPSFEVQPLNAMYAPATERYAVSTEFRHVGTDEFLVARYATYDKTSSASAAMKDYETAYGSSPSSPKVGDQVLYYGQLMSGGAPYVTRTFVRSGQIVLTLIWSRKDRGITVDMLAKNARVFVAGLKDLGKTRPKLRSADANLLPPPGVSITFLGSAQLSVEAFVVMTLTSIPEQFLALMRDAGITNFAYGDYALNNDTHMEVQSALLKFPTEADATDWANTFSPGKPDAQGIAYDYLPLGGTPAAGVYHFVFSSGRYGALLVCKSSSAGEAATRECEDPVHTVAFAWKLALGGLR